MITKIKGAPDNVAAFKAKGKVTQEDFNLVFETIEEKIAEYGELNYVMKLETSPCNFTAGGWVQDLMVGIKAMGKWNRCAIVSDNTAVDIITKFSNLLPIAEFKSFKKCETDQALQWASTGKAKSCETGSVWQAGAAGLAGAVALNIVHELVRKNADNVPAVNEVGEEALEKVLAKKDVKLSDEQLYLATLAGDIVSNGLYYAATATNKYGALSGILAGLGAVELPKYLGLDDRPVASTDRKKMLTVAYYTLGAAVTSLLFLSLTKRKK